MDEQDRGLGSTARGLGDRGVGQERPPATPQSQAVPPAHVAGPPGLPDEATLAQWREEARAAIVRRQGAIARQGWRVAGVEVNSFEMHELAQRGQISAYDYEIAVTITHERLEKGMSFSDINYSFSRDTYNVGELIRGERPATRTPVATRRMLDDKSQKVTQELQRRMQEAAAEQTLGISGPDVGTRARDPIDELIEICRVRINTAQTDEDFAKAGEELSKLQQVEERREEIDALFELFNERFAKHKAWQEKAAKERPTSQVARKRHIEAEASKQLVGVGEPVEVPAVKKLSAEERALIEARAKSMAARHVPKGGRLLSVTVKILEPGPQDLLVLELPDVEVTFSYLEGLDTRGIPSKRQDSFSVKHEELLSGEEDSARGPVVAVGADRKLSHL